MFDILKAEFRCFLTLALVYAAAHLMVLLFLTRVVDWPMLVPDEVYLVIAAVHGLTAAAGPAADGWLPPPQCSVNLLHRPAACIRASRWRCWAPCRALPAALLLPLLATAGWQATMTARVLDMRHVGLCLAGFGTGVIGCPGPGAAAMLVPRCTCGGAAGIPAAAGGVCHGRRFPGAAGRGGRMAAGAHAGRVQARPGHGATRAGRRAAGRAAAGGDVAAAGAGGFRLRTAVGGAGQPPQQPGQSAGRQRQAGRQRRGPRLQRKGPPSISDSAPLWREQAAISDIVTMGVGIPVSPVWHELGNRAPMEFDDDERRIRWVFSHDRGRSVGYRLSDKQPAGELASRAMRAFLRRRCVPVRGLLIGRQTLHAFDEQTQRVLPRVVLPEGEVVAGVDATGERLAVLSDRALYLYDARPLSLDASLLATRQARAAARRAGNLTWTSAELLDGHLVSFTMTRASGTARAICSRRCRAWIRRAG